MNLDNSQKVVAAAAAWSIIAVVLRQTLGPDVLAEWGVALISAFTLTIVLWCGMTKKAQT